MPLHQHCPDIASWRELLAGEATVAEQKALEDHLNVCPRCVEILDSLAEGTDGPPLPLDRLRIPPPPVEPALERVIQDVSRKR